MISLVEGFQTENTQRDRFEYAVDRFDTDLLIVVVTLYPFASYLGVDIPVSWAIALMVCLIPTTIGGLLSAIGIAGGWTV